MALTDDAREFWVAAATAAPIIALATLVSLGEVYPLRQAFAHAKPRGVIPFGNPVRRLFGVSYLILLTQVLVLTVALTALYEGQSPVPPVLVILIDAFGVTFLMYTSAMSGLLGYERARLEKEKRPLTATEQTSQAITWTLDTWANSEPLSNVKHGKSESAVEGPDRLRSTERPANPADKVSPTPSEPSEDL